MRLLAALLLAANLLFFSWGRGWLDDLVGVRASGDREPERFARQVRPDAVRVLSPADAASAASAAAASGTAAAAPVPAASVGASGAAGAASAAGAAGTPEPAASAAGTGIGPNVPSGPSPVRSDAAAAVPAVTGAAPATVKGAAGTAGSAALVCLTASPFGDGAFAAARPALGQAPPVAHWIDVRAVSGGAWMASARAATPTAKCRPRRSEPSRVTVAFDEA